MRMLTRSSLRLFLLPLAVAGGLLLASGSALEVRGQGAPARDGFWLNVGLGYGSLGCEGCESREGGLSGGLALGGAVSPRVLLGVGTNGWTKSEGGATLTVGTLTLLSRIYLDDTDGFHFLVGLGLGSVDLDLSGFGSASETGAGAVLGLGYDVPLSSRASLTLFWNGMGISADGGDVNVAQVGIGLTFH